ncbi:MAG: LysR family transcriptional regulator [Phycisphaerales bacterium]
MELTPLRYFQVIARCGHMTRAARELGVSQPALSAMLRKLEAEAGADLFHRTGRGVALTEAGRVFLVHAGEAIRGAEAGLRAVRELVGLERGSIRVGGGATAVTYVLPRVISVFRAAHPALRFYVREAGSSAVAGAVASGELDLGIVTLPLSADHEAEMMTVPLVKDELRLIVPPKHRLGTDANRHFRWRELEGEAIVAFEGGTAVRALIDEAAARAGVTLRVAMELRSIESIQQMVAAGIGVGFVSRFALREGATAGRGARAGRGEGLACRDGAITRTLAIVRRRDRMPSAAAAEFERVLRAGVA